MGTILVYLDTVDTVGDNSTNTPAVGILSKFDFLVLGPHTGADIANLTETIRAVKIANPTTKVFGYTSLGDNVDMATWQLAVDDWVTNLNHPTESLLDGIFIDKFGFEETLATRTNQNTAVNYVHGESLAVMANCTVPMNALNKYTSEADPVLGTSTTIKDYVFLEGFYFSKVPLATSLTLEAKDSLLGRLEYVSGARDNEDFNIGIVAVADMVNEIQVPVNDYKAIKDLAKEYTLDAVGFAPQDYGLTSNDYFFGKKINDLAG